MGGMILWPMKLVAPGLGVSLAVISPAISQTSVAKTAQCEMRGGQQDSSSAALTTIAIAREQPEVHALFFHRLRRCEAARGCVIRTHVGRTMIIRAGARQTLALDGCPGWLWSGRCANGGIHDLRLPRRRDHRMHLPWWLQPRCVGHEEGDSLIKHVKVTRPPVAKARCPGKNSIITSVKEII